MKELVIFKINCTELSGPGRHPCFVFSRFQFQISASSFRENSFVIRYIGPLYFPCIYFPIYYSLFICHSIIQHYASVADSVVKYTISTMLTIWGADSKTSTCLKKYFFQESERISYLIFAHDSFCVFFMIVDKLSGSFSITNGIYKLTFWPLNSLVIFKNVIFAINFTILIHLLAIY